MTRDLHPSPHISLFLASWTGTLLHLISIKNWFLWAWQTTHFFILLIDWSAQYIVKAVFSPDENGVNPADRRHSCCRERGLVAFTGLQLSSPNTWRPGKCQVFFKNVRSYISLLFILLFSSALSFHRLPSPRCLSLLDNVSVSRVSSTVWSSTLHLSLHAFFLFFSLLLLSSAPCFSDLLPFPFW